MEVILNAIGNAGLAATSLTTLLSSCALLKTNPTEIRLAAIEAFRRIPCAANVGDVELIVYPIFNKTYRQCGRGGEKKQIRC